MITTEVETVSDNLVSYDQMLPGVLYESGKNEDLSFYIRDYAKRDLYLYIKGNQMSCIGPRNFVSHPAFKPSNAKLTVKISN